MKRGFSRWLSFFALLSLFVSIKAVGVLAASPLPTVGAKQLLEGGDCLGDEILAWQRLRAERITVVEEDDSAPMTCIDGAGCVYLVTGSGKLMTSDDGGQNFVPYSGSPQFGWIDIAVDGQPVHDVQAMGVLKSTEPDRLWLGKPRGPIVIVYGKEGRLLVGRSDDDGKTWQSIGEVSAAGYGRLQAGGVRIVQLANATLLLAVAGWKAESPGDPEGLVFRSEDEGATWTMVGSLGPRCAGANLLELKSGELLAAISYQGARRKDDPGGEIKRKELFNHVVVARSQDGGKTWQDYQCVTRYKESPADLTELADGTVVLTYGEQNFPYGARAMVSKNGGQTWESRVYLLGYSTVQLVWPKVWNSSSALFTEPGRRVSSIVTKNGIIVSFYSRGSLVVPVPGADGKDTGQTMDKGKAVLAVHWTLKGMNKPPLSYPGVIGAPDAEGYLDNGRVQLKPEHLNWGGDYFSFDEILAYERVPAEHHTVGPGAGAIAALDPDGNPVVCLANGLIYRSRDSGHTWEHFSTAPRALREDNGLPLGWVQSFGILRDGTMLLALGIDMYRSADGGKTWSSPARLPMPSGCDSMGPDECQRINQLPDGTVLMNVCAGHRQAPGSGGCFTYRSRDGGQTWGDWSRGGAHNLLLLKSGTILGAVRDEREWSPSDLVVREDIPQNKVRPNLFRVVTTTFSEDNGYHWSTPRTVTRYNETPGDVAEMNDGRIVLTYHNKNNPNGARGMVSRDQGKTWDKTLYMLGWWRYSGGFTSSVVLKDGRVLTTDNGWSPGDNANLTHAIIWRPLGDK